MIGLMQVKVPVADLRREPFISENRYFQDRLQETQLLYGETVEVHREEGEWAYVEVPGQQKFCGGDWRGYPGWILKSALAPSFRERADYHVCSPWAEVSVKGKPSFYVSMGTPFAAIDEDEGRVCVSLAGGDAGLIDKEFLAAPRFDPEKLLKMGESLFRMPYHWGGRSAYRKDYLPLTSLDCSGLVHLLYQILGVALPRDARDQILHTEPCSRDALEIGDPVFLSSGQRVTHVMLYAGNGKILESSMSGGGVGLALLSEKENVRPAKFLTKNPCTFRIT